jgi:hypothetical protein
MLRRLTKRGRLLWQALSGRRKLERDMADELSFHLESRAADLARSGMSAEAARRARIEFGAVEGYKEVCREARGLRLFDELRGDLRYASRVLRKSPAFALTAVVTLALGIGANTAIFSAVKAVLLNQLPYRDPARLAKLGEADSGETTASTIGYATPYDWRRLSHSFESMSLYRTAAGAIVERGEPELLNGLRVNYDFFDTLGIRPQIGRGFLPEEDRPGRRFEVILAHGLWLRRFGGDPKVVGRVIRLSDASFTVVGVLPASFRPLEIEGFGAPEIFEPLGYALTDPFACRDCQHLQLIARLKPGVPAERVHAELNTIMADLVRQYPGSYPPQAKVAFEPLRDHLVGSVGTALWVLMGAVGFVLLIACVNVANLMLARAAGRAKEMALRAALGAARWRLIRQLLTESLLLAVAGGIAGVLLGWWCTSRLAAIAPREMPRLNEIHMDATVLWFALAVSLFTGVLFGLMPALRSAGADANDSLKESGKSTGSRSRRGLRDLLVMGELALAFVLAVGAGLLGKSLLRLMNVDPGFDPHHVLTLKTYVYGARYRQPEAELGYYEQVFARLRATPGIESVAMTSLLPMTDFQRRPILRDAGLFPRHANSAEAWPRVYRAGRGGRAGGGRDQRSLCARPVPGPRPDRPTDPVGGPRRRQTVDDHRGRRTPIRTGLGCQHRRLHLASPGSFVRLRAGGADHRRSTRFGADGARGISGRRCHAAGVPCAAFGRLFGVLAGAAPVYRGAAGALRRIGPGAGGGGDLRRGLLRGDVADAGNGHPHGAGRGAARCAGDGAAAGRGARGRRPRGGTRGIAGADTLSGELAVRSAHHGCGDAYSHRRAAGRRCVGRQLSAGASRRQCGSDGSAPLRVTRLEFGHLPGAALVARASGLWRRSKLAEAELKLRAG